MATRSIHQFAEKVVLVTDGTDPIGRAIAMQLALNGAFVLAGVPAGVDDEGLIEGMASLGTLASAIEYEPEAENGFEQLVSGVKAKFGRLDMLVECLKNGPESVFPGNNEVAQLKRSIEAASSLMSERPKAVAVCVFRGSDGHMEESENAIGQLTLILPENLRVNAVRIPETVGFAGGVSPDDAARVIFFLLSSEAKAINGQTIRLGYRGCGNN